LVQTRLGNKKDASRIWVQVKGKNKSGLSFGPAGTHSVRVKRTTALRWIRTTDLVVLVLFEVNCAHNDYVAERGWYAVPKDQLTDSELAEGTQKEISIVVRSSDTFDPAAARKLVWRARLDHAEQALCTLIAQEHALRSTDQGIDELIALHGMDLKKTDNAFLKSLTNDRITLLTDLMTGLGIIEGGRLSMAFGQEILSRLQESEMPEVLGEEALIAGAIVVAAQQRIRQVSQHPYDLIVTLPEITQLAYAHLSLEMERRALV